MKKFLSFVLLGILCSMGDVWAATSAPSDTVTIHKPGSVTAANLVSANNRKYEVFFSNNASTSSLLVGSNTSKATQSTGTNKWCNIGSSCGNTSNNISTAFTIHEFVSNVKASDNKAIRVQSTASAEKNVVMVICGYDSIATLDKDEVQLYAEEWDATQSKYGTMSKLSSSSTKTSSSHNKRTYVLDNSKQYRLTIAYGTSGSTNKSLVGFSLCLPAYSVSHSLTGVKATSGTTGANAATAGIAYNAIFTADDGYILPETITVTIGGNSATSEGDNPDYTWDSSSGEFQVPAAKVTGAIVVTIAGDVSSDPSISADDVNLSYSATNGEITYTLNNPVDGGSLTAEMQGEADWLTSIGTPSDGSISITTTPNTGAERSATVKLTYTYNTDQTKTKNVVVTQAVAKYTLAWNTNGGNALASEYTKGTVAYGTTITKPTDPTRDGHVFLGWAESAEGAVVSIPSTMPASNKTYYAQWLEGVAATVTYTLNTGTSAEATIKSSATPSEGSHISTADIDQSNAVGDGAGTGSDDNARTTKLPIMTGANGNTYENPTNYVLFTFSLANNYVFTPTDISIKIANVGGSSANNIKYKAVLMDAYNHSISTTYICTNGSGNVETFNMSNTGKVSFRGNVTLKLWAWTIENKSSGGSAFRMGTPLTITGYVSESSDTEFSVSVPATDANSKHWGTFSSSYKTFIPSANNTTVYSITGIDGSNLTLSSLASQSHSGELNEVAGFFVPANTGVLIKSDNSSVTYYTTSESVSDLENNMLYPGTGTTITSPTSCKYYLLGYGTQNDNSTLGFYYGAASGAAFQVRNGGAYLAIPDDGYAPAPGYRIIEEESTTTTLYNIESSEKAVKFFESGILYIMRDGVVYDALGRVVR